MSFPLTIVNLAISEVATIQELFCYRTKKFYFAYIEPSHKQSMFWCSKLSTIVVMLTLKHTNRNCSE